MKVLNDGVKEKGYSHFPKQIVRYLILFFKLCVSSTLFYFLLTKIGIKTVADKMLLLNPFSFAAAIVFYLLAAYISTLRWKLLIPQPIKTKRLFSMYMIGSFFNHYMPGGIGGDAVKAYYLGKEMKSLNAEEQDNKKKSTTSEPPSSLNHELTVAIASVFMDRYIGFGTLLTISLIVAPIGINYLRGASANLPVIWIIPSIAGVFVLLSIAVFKLRIGERLKFFYKAYMYIEFYAGQKKKLAKAALYSGFVQILGIISIYVLSKGLLLNVTFLSLLIFVPIIVIVSMVPVTISGIGLREGAFVFLLGTMGVSPEMSMALSIVWFLSVFAAGVWGFFEYLRFKTVFGGKKE